MNAKLAFIIALLGSAEASAVLVTDPLELQANQEFTATISPASGTVDSYGVAWRRNGAVFATVNPVSPSTTTVKKVIPVKSGDQVCAEVWAKNVAGETAHDQMCVVVDFLPALPGQPTITSITPSP